MVPSSAWALRGAELGRTRLSAADMAPRGPVAGSIAAMSPRTLLANVALGRLVFGLLLTAKPAATVGPNWIGAADAERPTSTLLFRSVGARDISLALGTLGALRQGGRLRPWLLGATLADVVDLVATLAAGKAVPAKGRASIVLLAGGAIVSQLALTRKLD
jgi:hypothetical protein